jgi:hypothetical protein
VGLLVKTRTLSAVLASVLAVLFAGYVWWGRPDKQSRPPSDGPVIDLDRIRPDVVAFCGDCHRTPDPNTFPRDAWFDEVNRGYEFYYTSGRIDLHPPVKKDVYAFYRAQAPESLELPVPHSPPVEKLAFRKTQVVIPSLAGKDVAPAVSHLKWIDSRTSQVPALLVCDMRLNQLQEVRFPSGQPVIERGVAAGHLGHVEPADLDGDSRLDYVLSDLGSFLPEDHDRGRVLWVRSGADGRFQMPVELAKGLGRVADARPADFDGDGDSDLVVAEFGYLKTGRILLLRNVGDRVAGVPRFELEVIDSRHGTINTPVIDINGDGNLDFLALVSQEHEVIEAFLNDGQGHFASQPIFAAADPSFGSSGMELTDLDGDGDVDLLYTNGDMYDSYYIKPYHAIHWVENRGEAGWQSHQLTTMPGVFSAKPADLDNDGDLDIVAVALVPPDVMNRHGNSQLDSVVWLEQVAIGKFERGSLESGATHHIALEVGDFDGDDDMDLAVGNNSEAVPSAVTIWWNETASGRVRN